MKSDHTIKIASLPSPAAPTSTLTQIKKPPLLGAIGRLPSDLSQKNKPTDPTSSASIASGLGKFKPVPIANTQTSTASGSSNMKAPIKLRPSSRTANKTTTSAVGSNGPMPIKVLPRPDSGFKAMAQKSMLVGSMPMVGSSSLASSGGFKKFKMSNVVTIGSSGKPAAGAAAS